MSSNLFERKEWGQADMADKNTMQDMTTGNPTSHILKFFFPLLFGCLLYTSDAADELDGVDLGGRRVL